MGEAIDRLTSVWDADFSKFDKAMRQIDQKTDATATNIERRLGGASDKVARDLARAGIQAEAGLGKGFDKAAANASTAIGRINGAAVGAAAGAAVATAAVVALTAAFQGSRAAAEYAANIKDTADAAHVTTDALQEYQFALLASGGESEKAGAAMANFSEKLGRAQAGAKGALNAFKALGFTREQVNGFASVEAALEAVVRRIGELKNASQQDAAIGALGLDDLAPLIRQGADEMSRLREEARRLGVVMDADLIRRGAEINDQWQTISRVIDVQVKSALVDLGPVFVTLLRYLAEFSKGAAEIADWFRDVDEKTTAGLKRQSEALKRRAEGPFAFLSGGRDRALALAAKDDAEIARREAAAKAPAPPRAPGGSRALQFPSGGRGRTASTPRDTTQERTEQVNAAVASATRDLLRAQLDLTINVEDRAKLEKAIAEEERNVALARIAKQQADLDDDKGLTKAKRAELRAQLDVVKAKATEAANLKVEAIDRETRAKTEREVLDLRLTQLRGEEDLLQIQASLARTAAERRDAELRLLDIADKREEIELQAIIASQTAADAEKKIAQTKLNQLQSSRGARVAAVNRATEGPLESYFNGLPTTIEQVNERMEALAVGGISDVIDGLAQAAVGARDFGDVFRAAIAQAAVELTKLNLQRMVGGMAQGGGGFGSLLSLFGGLGGGSGGGLASWLQGAAAMNPFLFAEGTNAAPGGLSIVGEKGPEILNIPRGAQVIPNDILRSLAARPAQRGGETFSPTLHVNLTLGPGVSTAEARRTGRQLASTAMREMALTKRRGY